MTVIWVFVGFLAVVSVFALVKFLDWNLFGGKYTYIDHKTTKTEFLDMLIQIDDPMYIDESLDRLENVPLSDKKLEAIRTEIVQSILDEKSETPIGPKTMSLIKLHIESLSREP